jgi:hypothetical protein
LNLNNKALNGHHRARSPTRHTAKKKFEIYVKMNSAIKRALTHERDKDKKTYQSRNCNGNQCGGIFM